MMHMPQHPEVHGTSAYRGLRDWFATPSGLAVLREIEPRLEHRLGGLFGYHAVQVGNVAPGRDLMAGSRIGHRVVLDPEAACAEVCADAASLPLQGDSVDLVLLVHALELSEHPHQVLREVDRVLVPEGHVLLVGFNPLSLFGLWKLIFGWRGRLPWAERFYTTFRIRDWLALLGFEVLACDYVAHFAPWARESWLRRGRLWERLVGRFWPGLGGVYLILGRKRVATLTPIKPRWRPRRAILTGNMTSPTTRGLHRVDDR